MSSVKTPSFHDDPFLTSVFGCGRRVSSLFISATYILSVFHVVLPTKGLDHEVPLRLKTAA